MNEPNERAGVIEIQLEDLEAIAERLGLMDDQAQALEAKLAETAAKVLELKRLVLQRRELWA